MLTFYSSETIFCKALRIDNKAQIYNRCSKMLKLKAHKRKRPKTNITNTLFFMNTY